MLVHSRSVAAASCARRWRTAVQFGHWRWRLPLMALLLTSVLTDGAGAQGDTTKPAEPQSETHTAPIAGPPMADKERAALVPLSIAKSEDAQRTAPPAVRIVVRPKHLGTSGQVWLRVTVVAKKPDPPVSVGAVPVDAPSAAAFRPLTVGKEEQFIVPLHGQHLDGNPADWWAIVAIEPIDGEIAPQTFEIEVVSATLLR